MKTLNSTLELADAIESLVASYVNSVRESAQQAVERAIANPITSTRPSSPATKRATAKSRPIAARRTPAELEEICDGLYERVRAQPGVSMVELAEQLGSNTRSLERPMTKMKAAGRVRCVGQRNLTRYYPAVVRAAGSGA